MSSYKGKSYNITEKEEQHVDFWTLNNVFQKSINNDGLSEDYGYVLNEDYLIYGNFNKSESNYLGHLIKEGYQPSEMDSKEIYEKISLQKENCQFLNINNYHVGVFATKNIKKGQEIFVSYGFSYWLNRRNNKN